MTNEEFLLKLVEARNKKLLEDWKKESSEVMYKMLMRIFEIFIGCGLLLALIGFIL